MANSRFREGIIWAAGVFEGEGCFSLHGRRRLSPRATLSMTDFDVVDRFRAAVGFGNITLRVYRPLYRDQRVWRVMSFEQVQAFVAMVWPWLGNRRKQRAIEVLTTGRQQLNRDANNRRLHCSRGHPYTELNTQWQSGKRRCRYCLLTRQRAARRAAGKPKRGDRVDLSSLVGAT